MQMQYVSYEGRSMISQAKNKITYFPENSFSLFDVVSLELYTLNPAVSQFFYPFEKVESLEAFKIRIHNLLIGRKFLFLPFWSLGIERSYKGSNQKNKNRVDGTAIRTLIHAILPLRLWRCETERCMVKDDFFVHQSRFVRSSSYKQFRSVE